MAEYNIHTELPKISRELRSLRIKKKKTVTDVQDETSFSAATLLRIEYGKLTPSREQVVTLCKYYGEKNPDRLIKLL